MINRVGIVGGGVVGQATAKSFFEHVKEVQVYDVSPVRRTHNSLLHVLESDLVFICLPSPQKEDDLGLDVTIIYDFFAELAVKYPHRLSQFHFVLKSTVPIGTTLHLARTYGMDIVHSPEFLTARCAVLDAQIPNRNIIGSNDRLSDTTGRLYKLYTQRFPHVPIVHCTSSESEAVKLFTNAFFATKVAFWNEMSLIAKRLKLDWTTLIDTILLDGRIHPSHTTVPGPDGQFGFGGTCLPKDLSEVAVTLKNLGWGDVFVTNAAYQRNQMDRGRQY